MTEFKVWAPNATTVTLVADATEYLMYGHTDGWWSMSIPGLDNPAREIDYGYRLNDGPIRPDPRSRRQPDGVHGLSRTFDPGTYHWQDTSWTGRQLAGGTIYELHIGTFTPIGTLDAAIGHLDHLVDLGIDFVELLPVNAFNGVHNWGYDGVLWFAVHEPYGGPAAYQRFVDACHIRGLGVIQDVVYNHLGPSGNYLPEFGPYLSVDHANTWGSSVNLDGSGSDEVHRLIIDNALMWCRDYHVDGLRLDAVHALSDSRATPIVEAVAVEIDVLSAHVGRPLSLIAESDLNDPKFFTPRVAGGYGLAGAWNDDVHHSLHVAVTGETSGYYSDFGSISALAKVFTEGYFHNRTYSSFRGRSHGKPIDTHNTEAWRLIAFLQDHDQIGNRAAGDRITTQASRRRAALGTVLLLTGPFTPMLFMGEEWAAATPWQFFTSHPEPELGAKTATGRIEEFARHGWDRNLVPDPQDPQTFTRSILNWKELEAAGHREMFDLYRALLDLRRTLPELTDPRMEHIGVAFDNDEQWITMNRGAVTTAVNFDREPHTLTLPNPSPGAEILLTTRSGPQVSDEGDSVTMPGECAAVFRRSSGAVSSVTTGTKPRTRQKRN